MMDLILANTECLLTLVGVVLYENLKGVTKALSIGIAAPMLGIVMTAVGVYMTFAAKKDKKGTAVALAIHAGLWLLKGVVGWVGGVAIAVFIILRITGKPGTNRQEEEKTQSGEMTFDKLPDRLESGGNSYYCTGRGSLGAQYVNERNPNDVVEISVIYNSTSSEVSTNAGHFYFLH